MMNHEPVENRQLMQLILDCHWLICAQGEGLTDRSIGEGIYMNASLRGTDSLQKRLDGIFFILPLNDTH